MPSWVGRGRVLALGCTLALSAGPSSQVEAHGGPPSGADSNAEVHRDSVAGSDTDSPSNSDPESNLDRDDASPSPPVTDPRRWPSVGLDPPVLTDDRGPAADDVQASDSAFDTQGSPTNDGEARSPSAAGTGTSRAGAIDLGGPSAGSPVTSAVALDRDTTLRVAIGSSPDTPDSPEVQAVLDALERGVRASASPQVELWRARSGLEVAPRGCRRSAPDLLLVVAYRYPDSEELIIRSFDCRLDSSLGQYTPEVAEDPRLVATVWSQHHAQLRAGARERVRRRLNPKVEAAIIGSAVGAVVVAGVVILLATTLRREQVVITVSP